MGPSVRPLRASFPLGAQLALLIAVVAALPLCALLYVGYGFFAAVDQSPLSFPYWGLLVVLCVGGTTALIVKIFAGRMARQMEPLAAATSALARGQQARPVPVVVGNELGGLAEKFNAMEVALADSRSEALARIRNLVEENECLRQTGAFWHEALRETLPALRTGLGAIASAGRIMDRYRDEEQETVPRFSKVIAQEVDRLLPAINGLSDLVRIDAGQPLLWHEEILDSVDLARAAVSTATAAVHRTDVSVVVEARNGTPPLRGDRMRLDQVLAGMLMLVIEQAPRSACVVLFVCESDASLSFSIGLGPDGQESGREVRIKPEATPHAESGNGRSVIEWKHGSPSARFWAAVVECHGGTVHTKGGNGRIPFFEVVLPALQGRKARKAGDAKGGRLRVVLLTTKTVLANCALRALLLEEIEGRACEKLTEVLTMMPQWIPDVLFVSPECRWQLTEEAERRLRAGGISHILICSPGQGVSSLVPPGQCSQLLGILAEIVPQHAVVLLADPDMAYASAAEFELTRAGYPVVKAHDVAEAVSRAVVKRPDVVIFEPALGGGVGEQLPNRLGEAGLRIPAVALTALDSPTLEKGLLKAGVQCVLYKHRMLHPALSEEAVARVKRTLQPVFERFVIGEGQEPDQGSTEIHFAGRTLPTA